MRKPAYISPSALALWDEDRDEYCRRYLLEKRQTREPQPEPAAVGSAFDAWVKSCLHSAIFGEKASSEYEFEALFESQVESHNRDFAREAGLHCFDSYVYSGAYDELLQMMCNGENPEFEVTSEGDVNGLPFLGKPDATFQTKDGARVILDWKVRQYCSKYAGSPTQGYKLCRDGLDWEKPSRSNEKSHGKYKPIEHHGLEINEGYFECFHEKWAAQLSIYSWLCGSEVGSEDTIIAIDEVVAKPVEDSRPLLRIAQHRSRVSEDYQLHLMSKARELWHCISTGHIFSDLSRDDSDERFGQIEREVIQNIIHPNPVMSSRAR